MTQGQWQVRELANLFVTYVSVTCFLEQNRVDGFEHVFTAQAPLTGNGSWYGNKQCTTNTGFASTSGESNCSCWYCHWYILMYFSQTIYLFIVYCVGLPGLSLPSQPRSSTLTSIIQQTMDSAVTASIEEAVRILPPAVGAFLRQLPAVEGEIASVCLEMQRSFHCFIYNLSASHYRPNT